ncbi:UNVERIFIED_CONTAM: hypothetical protein Sangu_0482900 [Sesamum angustifolium]|uniref:DDE Tnp4 domain-containing protein n=1 Tax=Sesamum angustifolium TaxID=2727405 RepID=A0AAW2Q7X2_9LAMI
MTVQTLAGNGSRYLTNVLPHNTTVAVTFSNSYISSEVRIFKIYLWQGCLGALDGTFIDVRVLEHEKGHYRTRKGQVAVNVLGVCNPNIQFILFLSGWEGSAIDNRVLRDAIHRPNGLRVPTGAMDADFFSTAHVNTLDYDGSSQQKRRGNNKDRSGPRWTWTLVEE